MRVSRRLVTALVAILAGAVAGAVWAPGHRQLVVSAAVMTALAALLVEMGRTAQALSAEGRAWSHVRHEGVLSERRPSDLEQLERVLGWGRYSPGDFNYEVRPLLLRLVTHRLVESHGVDADARPDAARALLSDDLWELVVAKLPPETGRVVQTEDIVHLVDEIEAI